MKSELDRCQAGWLVEMIFAPLKWEFTSMLLKSINILVDPTLKLKMDLLHFGSSCQVVALNFFCTLVTTLEIKVLSAKDEYGCCYGFINLLPCAPDYNYRMHKKEILNTFNHLLMLRMIYNVF
jgi:hypothetical protein